MRNQIAVCRLVVLLLLGSSANATLRYKAIAAGNGYNLGLASDGTVWIWGQVPVQVGGLTEIVAIATGRVDYSTSWGFACNNVALKSDGSVWEWMLLNGVNVNTITAPSRVGGVTRVVAIAEGHDYSLALKSDGTVWAWGLNSHGELGDGTTTYRSSPIEVSGLTGVVAIAAGAAHSLAVKSDGTVWAWGDNSWGQLGNGTITPAPAPSVPVQVSGLTGVVAVSAGFGHSLALRYDGTVSGWGLNGSGQLGDGTAGNVRPTPVQAGQLTGIAAITASMYSSLAVNNDGTVWEWGDLGADVQSTPILWSGPAGVATLAGSPRLGLALKIDGTVWAWGGILGDGTAPMRPMPGQVSGLSDVTAVDANGVGGLALTHDGTVWNWGNGAAPLQVNGLNAITAMAAGVGHNMALQSDGTVWEWGGQSAPSPVSGLTGAIAIAAGESRSLAVKGDGTVWQWIGKPAAEFSNVTAQAPAQVSGLSGVTAVSVAYEWWWGGDPELIRSLALKSDGTVWIWDEGEQAMFSTPVQVGGISGIVSIAAGYEHIVALKGDGTVWELDAQPSDALPTQVGELTGVVALAAGDDQWDDGLHGLALKRDGTVWAWGGNCFGELGDGTIDCRYRTSAVQVGGIRDVEAVAAAGDASLAIKRDGTLWTWGANITGVAASVHARLVPVQVIAPGSPDLAIAMSHHGDFAAGSDDVYSISISNVGGSATTGMITVTDILPPGLSYVSGVGSGWNCSAAGEIVACTNAGPIDAGASSAITLTVVVEPQACPGVTNLAMVSNGSDRNVTNDIAGDPTVVSAGK